MSSYSPKTTPFRAPACVLNQIKYTEYFTLCIYNIYMNTYLNACLSRADIYIYMYIEQYNVVIATEHHFYATTVLKYEGI